MSQAGGNQVSQEEIIHGSNLSNNFSVNCVTFIIVAVYMTLIFIDSLYCKQTVNVGKIQYFCV